MWRISDLREDKSYVLCLCHSSESQRFFRLVEEGQALDPSTAFVTARVPTDLLRKRDLILISELIPLASGERFFVDAHCIWFTGDEMAQLREDPVWDSIQWSTSTAPLLPPA
jgi:hypothetical protein